MKKLTAGIFAGILTIVAVNAANAEIASKGYVDAINTAIRNTDVMKSGITSEKVEQYDALVYGSDSVASQIADALGADFPENSDVITELNKKQDKLGAANVKVSETKGSGNVVTAVSAEDGVVTIEKGTTLGALATESKVTDSFIDDGAISQAKVNGLSTDLQGKANVSLDNLNEAGTAKFTAKQDKLGVANVIVSETKGSGNVVTAVSAADGVVTIEKETTLGALATLNGECTKMGNKCVLTYGSDGYKWEIVERAASELGAE